MLTDLTSLLELAAKGMVAEAEVIRGANFIKAMESEYPIAYNLLMSFLYKAPEVVIKNLGQWFPAFKGMEHNPNLIEFIESLQTKLKGAK